MRSYLREGTQVAVLDVKDDLGRELVTLATETGPGAADFVTGQMLQIDGGVLSAQ